MDPATEPTADVPSSEAVDRHGGPDKRSSQRSIGLVAVAVLVLAGLGVAGFTAVRGVAAPSARGAPRFVDETSTSGVDLTYGGDFTFAVGGGVAVFDCSGDGRPEI